jgi:hypothetical protein
MFRAPRHRPEHHAVHETISARALFVSAEITGAATPVAEKTGRLPQWLVNPIMFYSNAFSVISYRTTALAHRNRHAEADMRRVGRRFRATNLPEFPAGALDELAGTDIRAVRNPKSSLPQYIRTASWGDWMWTQAANGAIDIIDEILRALKLIDKTPGWAIYKSMI